MYAQACDQWEDADYGGCIFNPIIQVILAVDSSTVPLKMLAQRLSDIVLLLQVISIIAFNGT